MINGEEMLSYLLENGVIYLIADSLVLFTVTDIQHVDSFDYNRSVPNLQCFRSTKQIWTL